MPLPSMTRLALAKRVRSRPVDPWIRRYRIPPCGRSRWPMRWWAHLRERLWLKWSDEYVERVETIEVTPKVEKHILAAIGNSVSNIEELFYGNLKHVVVGPAQMAMVREAACVCSFPMSVDYVRYGVCQVYGLTVHLIPWFDGCLLLPDLEEA